MFNSNPPGFTIAWCSGAAHTDVSFLMALPVDVYAVVAVLVVDVMGCPLHLELFKAVWLAKHAGLSGYTSGMAGET